MQSSGRPPSVAVLIPVHGSVPAKCFGNIVSFLLSLGRKFPLTVLILEATIIFESRNKLLEQFLKTNADYAFFLDSDMIVPSGLVEKLLSWDKDVVSGLAFTRTSQPKPAIRKKVGESYEAIYDYLPDSLVEVDAVGLYSLLLKRTVVQKLFEKNNGIVFEVERNKDGELKGENICFCEKLKDAGFGIFVDTGAKVGHFGGVIFPFQLPKE